MATGYGKRRGRLPALLAVLSAVVGAALLWLGLSGWAQGPHLTLGEGVQQASVQVGPQGLSLWSTDADAYASTVCEADGRTLLRPVTGYGVEVGGVTYHELARSPRGLSGQVSLSCRPAQDFHVGTHAAGTAVSGVRGTSGVLAGAALLGLGLVLGAGTLLAGMRRRRRESFRVPARRLDPGLAPREAVAGGDGPAGGPDLG